MVCRLGLTQWNLNSFGFKFDDARLSHNIKIRLAWQILVLSWHCSVSALFAVSEKVNWQERDRATSGRSKKINWSNFILISGGKSGIVNLSSKVFSFHCVRPNVDKYVTCFVHEIIVILLAVLCSSNECVCMYLCM